MVVHDLQDMEPLQHLGHCYNLNVPQICAGNSIPKATTVLGVSERYLGFCFHKHTNPCIKRAPKVSYLSYHSAFHSVRLQRGIISTIYTAPCPWDGNLAPQLRAVINYLQIPSHTPGSWRGWEKSEQKLSWCLLSWG